VALIRPPGYTSGVRPSFQRYRDSHHPEWVTRAYDLAPPGFRALLEDEASWLAGEVGGGPVLEAGCGAGRLLRATGLDRPGTVGLELVLRYLAAARRTVREAALVAGDALRPPLPPGTFETVILAQATLGSVGGEEVRRRFVSCLAALVRPGGRLLLTAYGARARAARRAWYEAQQAAGLLPPFDPERTRDGRFAFADGFVSEEMDREDLARLRPPGFSGEVRELPSGLLAARWTRAG